MVTNILPKFDLESALHEAYQRCVWFIDGYGQHGLDVELYNVMSTEDICYFYNVDISFFRKNKQKNYDFNQN